MPQPNPTTALTDLAALYHRLGLSEQAIRVVEMIRRSNPARAVRGGRSNVTSRYPSRKMGVTVQAESHKVELAAMK